MKPAWNRRDALAILFLVAWQCVYFFPVTLAQAVWFGSDTVRTYFPLGTELARALHEGRLPLWTTGMYGGFPLLADAQVGALYPINLILYAVLPPHFALSYTVLFHLAFAAVGAYLWVRASGFRVASALLAGIVFSFSGFMLSRLPHVTILVTSSWLPWLFFLQDQFQRAQTPLVISSGGRNLGDASRDFSQKSLEMTRTKRAALWFALLALALGIQVLCGFPQVAFMNLLAVGLVGFFGRLLWDSNPFLGATFAERLKSLLRAIGWSALPILLGAGIAAAQIVPTVELVGYSVRGSASSFRFVTSYSLPPEMLAQFVAPFIHGEPSEGANNEYWAYLGLAPFLLALLAVWLRRDARTIFFAVFALAALSLALGDLNPVYRLIYQLPGLSFFRVPARYLLLFVFAATFLTATGFEELSNRLSDARVKCAFVWACAFGGAIVVVIWLAQTQWLEFWMAVWQYLPMGLLAASVGVLGLAWMRRASRALFQTIVLGLTLCDLACTAPLFVITLGRLDTPAYAASAPRSLSVIETRPGDGRVFTDMYIDSSVAAIRAGLYPNAALLYGKESAQAYSSLAFARQSAYLADLTPSMLNLLNVRYFAVPLEPRPETKSVAPLDTLGLDVLNNEEVFPPVPATGVEIISFTERAENLANGTPVGELVLRRRDGRIETFPLRVGIETADWDYARNKPQHARAPVAHTFRGFWRAFGREFEGNTYAARFSFAPGEIVGVNVRALRPEARLTIERISLYNADNQPTALAKLVHRNDFALAYLSDTVAIWENKNALPRAFIAHAATVANDDAAFARLRDPSFQPEREVLLSEGGELRDVAPARDSVEIATYKSGRVAIKATTDQPGYLVLADSWYPGWNALVDGRSAPIHRADVLFRAVRIEPGTHDIEFEYRPLSFAVGATISAISLLIALGIPVFYLRYGKK